MWEAITMIEAQEQLKLLSALDWPHMKRQQRQKLHKELYNKAYPSNILKRKKITIEDLKRMQGV